MMRHVVFEQNDTPRRPFAGMLGKIAALAGGINGMLIPVNSVNATQSRERCVDNFLQEPRSCLEKRPEGLAAGHCPNASGPQPPNGRGLDAGPAIGLKIAVCEVKKWKFRLKSFSLRAVPLEA